MMSTLPKFLRSCALAALLAVPVALPAWAQADSDLLVRLDQLQSQMRNLTGAVEQLQFRNQQLEQQVRRLQDELAQGGARPATPAAAPGPAAAPAGLPPRNAPAVAPAAPPVIEPTAPAGAPRGVQRRSDAFDPAANPSAPGVPRALGSGAPVPGTIVAQDEGNREDNREVGAPGGREAGEPLDLATIGGGGARQMPQQSAQGQSQVPVQAQAPVSTASVAPPSQSPRDLFDLGYGFMLRKEYAAAEETFRDFLKRHASDRLTVDAHYWLGESLYQRQRFRDAAESFLVVTTKFDSTARAPEALLRLGQALAALGEKEAACAAMGEVSRKYPKASAGVKQGVDRELKRVRC